MIYWIGFGGTFFGALSWYHQFVAHLAVFLGCAAGCWALWNQKSPVRVTVLPRGLSAGLALLLLEKAARVLSAQSWQAGEDLAEAASLAIAFYLLLNLMPEGGDLAFGLLLASSFWCVAGMIVAHERGYRELAMPLGNRVLMAGLLVLVLPLVAGLWTHGGKGRLQKVALLTGGSVLLVGLVQTRSASALVVLVLTCLLGALGVVPRRLRVLAFMLVTLGIFSSLWLVGGWEPIARLKAVIWSGEDPVLSWNNRVRYWVGAIPAVRDRLLFGYGPGQVGLLYPRYRLQQPGMAPHGEVVPDLHSAPLNWLFEFGLTGVALRVSLYLGFVIWALVRGNRLQKSAAAGLAGYGFYSLFHYQLGNPAIFWVTLCVALIAARRLDAIELSTRWATTALSGLLICISVAIFSFQCRLDYANFLAARSYSHDSAKAAASAIRAALLDKRGGFYDFVAALRIRELLDGPRSDSGESEFLFGAASRHYSAALDQYPLMPQVLASYGAFLMRRGKPCLSLLALRESVSLDFYFSLSHFDLANAYVSCGPNEMAVSEAAIAILVHPTLAYATEWRKRPEFLATALERSFDWLSQWDRPSGERATAQLQSLTDFLRARIHNPAEDVSPIVALTFSDSVAGQPLDDPFAFIFHRRSPYFETTQIRIDGLPSGTWAPQGIGSFRWLRALTYDTVKSAYEQQGLETFMVSLGNLRRRS